ncbi:MAG: primosomal protein N' [Clostridia bacterium]|nr:primosomal protein N' [Clostridia bacterium]
MDRNPTKQKFLIAGVCVLGNHFSEDGVYDYAIPPEMGDEVYAGRFVTVPFGIRNRPCTGLVMEVRDTSKYSEHKFIRSLFPEAISMDAEQMMLCDYMRLKLMSDTEAAVRAMMPVAAFAKLTEFVSLAAGATRPKDSGMELDAQLFDYLSEQKEVSVATLRRRFDIRVEASLRRLTAKKAIEKRTVLTEAKEGAAERRWELRVDPETAKVLAEGKECLGRKVTSHQQTKVLAAMVEEDAPMTTAELTERADVTASVLKTLEKAGMIECVEYRTARNPYTDIPFEGRTPLTLNEEQTAAAKTLADLMDTGEAKAALLYGVTGSGKTRVITALIDRMLDAGRAVILLLPEIALTPQSVAIFCTRYGERVAVMHSGLSTGERYDAYCRIRRGEADVVIGTRSAVFAPVQNLGAVIIDEEQEHTYKSDRDPRYHAREVARRRCAYHNAMMVLASATPLVETMDRARRGIYTEIRLTDRYGAAELPKTEIVDLREEAKSGNNSVISARLADAIAETLTRGEQSILFLNRRGYNRTVTCRSCGQPITCPNCSVAMTYHTYPWSYREGQMRCHWCGTSHPLPKVCPKCGGEHLAHIGYGTQHAEEELHRLFPTARVLRMDADTTSTKHAFETMLGKFRRHEADILLGTQMVTKGHDFPDVTLVGVLQADTSLYIDDYRAGEQTFAMLTQVIGRAGRRERPGLAIIQTMSPDHDVIRLACEQDYEGFFKREMQMRKLLTFPPFCDIAMITMSSESEDLLVRTAARVMQDLPSLREQFMPNEPLLVYGPFEAPVYRVDNRCRLRVIIKCRVTDTLNQVLSELIVRAAAGTEKKVRAVVDFNPNGT